MEPEEYVLRGRVILNSFECTDASIVSVAKSRALANLTARLLAELALHEYYMKVEFKYLEHNPMSDQRLPTLYLPPTTAFTIEKYSNLEIQLTAYIYQSNQFTLIKTS